MSDAEIDPFGCGCAIIMLAISISVVIVAAGIGWWIMRGAWAWSFGV